MRFFVTKLSMFNHIFSLSPKKIYNFEKLLLTVYCLKLFCIFLFCFFSKFQRTDPKLLK